MKKKDLFIGFLLVALLLLSINLAAAQTDQLENIEENLDNLEDFKDVLTDKDSRDAYLNTKWTEALNNTKIGPSIERIQTTIKSIDPAFEILLGTTFTFSFTFFLTLILWISLIIISINLAVIIEVYFGPERYAKLAKYLASIVFIIFISTIRIPRYFSAEIISAVSKIDNKGVQVMLAVGVVVILISLIAFSFSIKSQFKKEKTENTIKSNKKNLKEQGRKIENLQKNMEKGKYQKEKTMEEEIEEEAREDLEGISEDV